MAKYYTYALLALTALIFAHTSFAAIPVRWTTDAYKVKPLVYECYHGETLDLAASLTAYGEPLDFSGKTAKLYWQTNGMESAWWSTNAQVRAESGATNVLAAIWSGAYDTGAERVTGFIGLEGENYRAAFELRFRASPGFSPSTLPTPTKTIDWAKVTNTNVDSAPFALKGEGGGGVSTNGINALIHSYDETNLAWRINAKQDKLTAGANITITADNVISATGGGGSTDLTPATNYANRVATSATNYTDTCCSTLANSATNYANTAASGAVVAATNAAAADAAGKYLPATKDDEKFYIKNDVVFIRDDLQYPSVEFYGNVFFEGVRNWATDGNTINLGETGFQQIVDASNTTLQDALDEKANTSSLAAVATSGSYDDLSDKPTIPAAQIQSDWTQTNTSAKDYIKNKPTIPSLDGYATEDYVDTANATTRAIVQTWEGFLDGSNVVFSITNYISGSYNLNEAKLRILEMTNGVYREVYNSRGEIVMHLDNFKTNDFRVATNKVITAVNAAVANKADKAWGKYTSAGGDAPSNTVYMTAPNTVFAGGMEYERVAVGEGSVCVLTTKGAPVWTQGDEGTFKFQDDGGTNYFGFAKTDSYVIGANTDGITVQSNIVTLEYDVTMSGVPCIWYKGDLATATPWEQLNTSDGNPIAGASHIVQWETNPPAGQELCYINCPEAKGFFKATIEVPGSAKFMTNMPADLGGGILCTNTATGVMGKIKPSYNGSQVIWTWSGL